MPLTRREHFIRSKHLYFLIYLYDRRDQTLLAIGLLMSACSGESASVSSSAGNSADSPRPSDSAEQTECGDTGAKEETEHQSPERPEQAEATPLPGQAEGVPVEASWQCAFDRNSQRHYWYCQETGVSVWHAPPGWEGQPCREAGGAQQPESGVGYNPSPDGYFYVDAEGTTQGPFDREQLRAWRGHLPMDLPMWRPGDEAQQYLATVLGDDGLLRQWHDANPEEAERVCLLWVRWMQGWGAAWPSWLDHLVGQARRQTHQTVHVCGPHCCSPATLVCQGVHRRQPTSALVSAIVTPLCPSHAQGPSRAPPAAIYEAEERGGSAAGYAAAALAGLPPDDDAVRVRRGRGGWVGRL